MHFQCGKRRSQLGNPLQHVPDQLFYCNQMHDNHNNCLGCCYNFRCDTNNNYSKSLHVPRLTRNNCCGLEIVQVSNPVEWYDNRRNF